MTTPSLAVNAAAAACYVEYRPSLRPPLTLVLLLTQCSHNAVPLHCLFCLLIPLAQPLNPHPDFYSRSCWIQRIQIRSHSLGE